MNNLNGLIDKLKTIWHRHGKEVFWFIVFVLLLAAMEYRSGLGFAAVLNISLRQGSVLILLTMAEAFPMITGSIDLSIGATMSLCSLAYVGLVNWCGFGIIPIILLGAVIGTLNGALVTRLRCGPAVTTFGTASLISAVSMIICSNSGMDSSTILLLRSVSSSSEKLIRLFFHTQVFGISSFIILLILLPILYDLFICKTFLGIKMLAVGESRTKSQRMGVNIKRTLMAAHIMAGIGSAITAIVFSGINAIGLTSVNTSYLIYALVILMLSKHTNLGRKGFMLRLLFEGLSVAALRILLSGFIPSASFDSLLASTLLILTAYFSYKRNPPDVQHW